MSCRSFHSHGQVDLGGLRGWHQGPVRLEVLPVEQVAGSAGLRIGDYKVDHSVCASVRAYVSMHL